MKSKGLLFSVLSAMCVGLVAGCGETEYTISATPISNEYGVVTGGGKYKKGATVTLNITANMGCRTTGLTFFKTEEGEHDEIPLNDIGEGSVKYQFAVSDDTIGNYVANFECQTNSPSDDDSRVMKHKVTYILNVEGNPVTVIDNSSNAELEDNIELVEMGKVATEIKYIDGLEGKIVWYTKDPTLGSVTDEDKYNFANKVVGDLNLWGQVVEVSNEEAVNEAVDAFKSSKNLEITNGDEVAIIIDFDKEIEKINMKVSTKENVIKYIIQNNTYYLYKDPNKAGLKLENSGFGLRDIKEAYKFIELRDIVLSEFNIIKNDTKEEVTVDEGKTYNCNVYLLKDKTNDETVMSLYIYNGKVYKVVKGESTNVINYKDSLAGTNPSAPKDMYLVRVHSSDSGLGGELQEINGDFAKILKIVPAYGETLKETLEKEELFNILKKYDYEWTKYVNGSCTIEEYKFDSVVNSNVNMCVKINASIDYVENALNRFIEGNYDVITSIKIFDGELETRYNSIASETNLFADGVQKPTGMSSATWNTIKSLRDLMETYYSFKYNSASNEYSFFKSKTDLVNPYLVVKLNSENTLIERVTYFAGYTVDGDRNTYTSEFIYPSIKNSVRENVEYIKDNYYNKEVGFDFTTVEDLDDHFYTLVSYVGDVSKIKIAEDVYDNSLVRFSVGNNNFIERSVWKVVDGKLYVSSAILESYMLRSIDGELQIETLDSSNEVNYSVAIDFEAASLVQSPISDVSGSEEGILDGFNYTSSNGTDSIRIKLGNDVSLADVSVFAICEKDGVIHFAYTKLAKIGQDYYLVLYPEYSAEGYTEDKTFEYKFTFVASNGAWGVYTFNVTLVSSGSWNLMICYNL